MPEPCRPAPYWYTTLIALDPTVYKYCQPRRKVYELWNLPNKHSHHHHHTPNMCVCYVRWWSYAPGIGCLRPRNYSKYPARSFVEHLLIPPYRTYVWLTRDIRSGIFEDEYPRCTVPGNTLGNSKKLLGASATVPFPEFHRPRAVRELCGATNWLLLC